MISRSAVNTEGRRLRSSSVNTPPGSATVTLAVPAPSVTAPARRSAPASTGSRTSPRSLRARTVIVRPDAVISTGGST
jgi:hypothetical protein